MKFIKYIIIFTLNITFLSAQCEDLTYGCDTVTTNNNLSNYTEYYKQKSFKDAFSPWKWLVDNAPQRTKNLYLHGPKILKGLIEKSEDVVEKDNLIQDLFKIYDLRLKYYPGKEGYVLALKGKDMYKYKSSTIEELKACRLVLQNSFEIDGLNSTATTINYFFNY